MPDMRPSWFEGLELLRSWRTWQVRMLEVASTRKRVEVQVLASAPIKRAALPQKIRVDARGNGIGRLIGIDAGGILAPHQ
jgi:hypothetical protein